MRLLAYATLLAALYAPAASHGYYLSDKYEQVVYEQALERIKGQPARHVMVYFSMATNCPPCNYTKNLLNGPNLLERYKLHYVVVHIDIRDPRREEDRKIIAKYKARWAPTLVFVDHKGKLVARIPKGFNNEKEAVLLDEFVSQRLYRKTDFREYFTANFNHDGAHRVVPETRAQKPAVYDDRMRLRDVLAQNHERMAAEELKRQLPGMLLHKETAQWVHTLALGADGSLTASGNKKDGTDTTRGAGSWTVSDESKLCVDMKWRKVEEQWCRYVYRVGEDFYAVNEIRDNMAAHRFTLEPVAERTSN